MINKINMSDIKANPFHVEGNDMSNVARLRQDKYYKGIVGRLMNNKVEIAFGHDRWKAAELNKELYLDIDILELTDDDMILLMHKENYQRKQYSIKQLKTITEEMCKRFNLKDISHKLNIKINKLHTVLNTDYDLLDIIDKGKRAKDVNGKLIRNYNIITETNAYSLSRIKNKTKRNNIMLNQKTAMTHARTFNKAITAYLKAPENIKEQIENGSKDIIDLIYNNQRQIDNYSIKVIDKTYKYINDINEYSDRIQEHIFKNEWKVEDVKKIERLNLILLSSVERFIFFSEELKKINNTLKQNQEEVVENERR